MSRKLRYQTHLMEKLEYRDVAWKPGKMRLDNGVYGVLQVESVINCDQADLFL